MDGVPGPKKLQHSSNYQICEFSHQPKANSVLPLLTERPSAVKNYNEFKSGEPLSQQEHK